MRKRALLILLAAVTLMPIGASAIPPTPADGVLAGNNLAEPERCDQLDTHLCLFPFPNDLYTKQDPTTDTGLRLNISPLSTPRNVAGKPIDPTEWNRNDGFSPGSLLQTVVPTIDLAQTGAPHSGNIGASLDTNSPIVIINTRTGARHPYWAELDSWATDAAHRALLIRPAVNFDEATRYVVGLRNLKDAAGNPIPAGEYFKRFRDGITTDDVYIERRRPRMESILGTLGTAGVARSDLFLAWDFTIASERNLSERILHIRNDAFASLGDTTMADRVVQGESPRFKVTQVTNNATGKVSRVVEGVFTVPNYVKTPLSPGGGFVYGLDGLPVRLGSTVAQFTCQIPRAALSSSTGPATVTPARPGLYGHGLLGSRTEVGAGNVTDMANEKNFVFCATEWAGMATIDVPNAVHTLLDVSNFSTMTDRMQQGFVNQMFLGRLMIHKDGLVSDPAFQSQQGQAVIDRTELFYDGNSQGGIMGGALMAVTPDVRRGVLGVPAMNYSTLLDRSSDWPLYYTPLSISYPNRLDQQFIIGFIQILWDRGEANGYAHHMTSDPLPNTPSHTVLLHLALGDHQVSNDAAYVEARTIGAAIYQPAITASKIPVGVNSPFWNIPDVATMGPQYTGSVLVLWDAGNLWPPLDNRAPSDGRDPHSRPRATPSAREQKSLFLQTNGYFKDVCSGGPCLTT